MVLLFNAAVLKYNILLRFIACRARLLDVGIGFWSFLAGFCGHRLIVALHPAVIRFRFLAAERSLRGFSSLLHRRRVGRGRGADQCEKQQWKLHGGTIKFETIDSNIEIIIISRYNYYYCFVCRTKALQTTGDTEACPSGYISSVRHPAERAVSKFALCNTIVKKFLFCVQRVCLYTTSDIYLGRYILNIVVYYYYYQRIVKRTAYMKTMNENKIGSWCDHRNCTWINANKRWIVVSTISLLFASKLNGT